MFYGKIENGILVQRQRNPQDGFVEIPSNVVCGMEYDEQSGEWSDPEISLSQAKQNSLSLLLDNYEKAAVSLLEMYQSPFERLTWNTQVFEASLVTAAGSSGSNDTPFFDAFVSENPDFAGVGSTEAQNKALLKQTIESNNSSFASAAGSLTGQLSAKRHAIMSASTNVEVELVDLTFVVPSISVEDKF